LKPALLSHLNLQSYFDYHHPLPDITVKDNISPKVSGTIIMTSVPLTFTLPIRPQRTIASSGDTSGDQPRGKRPTQPRRRHYRYTGDDCEDGEQDRG